MYVSPLSDTAVSFLPAKNIAQSKASVMTMSLQYTGLLCIIFIVDLSRKNDTYLSFLVTMIFCATASFATRSIVRLTFVLLRRRGGCGSSWFTQTNVRTALYGLARAAS